MTGITGGISSPDFIQFDTTATVTPATGRLYFNDGEGGLAYTLKGGNVVQEVGQSQQVLVYNGTGATLNKGQVVYSNGAQGQRPTVALALATSDATSARTLGIVAESIANGAEGWVTTLGVVENINTSAFTAGAQLYLSGSTAGALTATKPVAPIHMVYVARCIKSHASSGRLFVTVQNGYELDELHDVAAVSPSNGQTIVYNSTTSLWEKNTVSLTAGVNGTLPAASGGTGLTSPGTTGNVLVSNGTAWTSAAPAGGGINYTTKTSSYTAADKDGILANTSAGAFTVTLPSSPSAGNQVIIADAADTWGSNNLTIARNGATIEGLAENLVCDINGASIQLIYTGTTWQVYAQIGAASGSALTASAIGVTVQGYDADLQAIGALSGTSGLLQKTAADTWTLNTTAYAPVASPTFSGTVSDALGKLRAIPQTGAAKTSSYTLTTADVGTFVNVGSGGSVTIPNSTFATGDAISIYNDTTGSITITCSITTSYIGGTNTDKNTMTLATRGVATILFISGTVCVVTGNVA
jgi:hypothetical protein